MKRPRPAAGTRRSRPRGGDKNAILSARPSLAAAPIVLSLGARPASARRQDKFKLGMAVGGNTCCEWMKAQGDVARALAEREGWDYVELSNNDDPATAVKNAQIFVQQRRRRGDPVQRPAVVEPGGQPGDEGGRHPDRHLRHRRSGDVLRRHRQPRGRHRRRRGARQDRQGEVELRAGPGDLGRGRRRPASSTSGGPAACAPG